MRGVLSPLFNHLLPQRAPLHRTATAPRRGAVSQRRQRVFVGGGSENAAGRRRCSERQNHSYPPGVLNFGGEPEVLQERPSGHQPRPSLLATTAGLLPEPNL